VTPLPDAHLHATRLDAPVPPSTGSYVAVGTSPDDWGAVLDVAARDPRAHPAIGVHPWYLAGCAVGWEVELRRLLVAHPAASVGEVGIDRAARAIAGLDEQVAAFRAQVALAAALDRAVSVHAVRAHDDVVRVLRTAAVPRRGVLLHGYAGPAQLVPALAAVGCRFSFAPGLEASPARVAAFAAVPADRLCVETDAPSRGRVPEDLAGAYRALAAIRGIPVEALASDVAATFTALFG